MREIKFRGRLINSGKWSEGNLIIRKGNNVEIMACTSPDATPIGTYGRIDVNTIGQYTGLKDKNGKEIYEGDIVKVHFDKKDAYTIHTLNLKKSVNKIGKIKYIVDGFCVFIAKFGENIYPLSCFGDEIIYDLEVIGNIYENPELLEV